jgi:hypothetical protein
MIREVECQESGVGVFTKWRRWGRAPVIHRSADEKSARRHTSGISEANIYRGAPPLAAINAHGKAFRLFCPQYGNGPVVYRRTFIARRPATDIMSHCSWSVQPSDDRALELLAHNINQGGAKAG